MSEEITWLTDRRVVINPLPRPDKSDLESIPLGSEMILVNMGDEGVSFSGGAWSEKDRREWTEMLDDEHPRFEDTVVFYVKPTDVKDAEAPLADLPTPDQVADRVLTEALENGRVSDIRELLTAAVRYAREGLVQNPF